ncbi:sensor histidine kinase [Cohnella nanjingensis]|uniref:histidine kinase n=1 Tax=Cohnella nanjingensis TaxID=1387779 RepID=A0A7X0VFK4_9BACL|nr:HAMP domain-containing sensor histidine kinase [Cohnella nanjingensis]MBB6672160.1 HAMP domain-containing histidine kinase [Cohnella nanjingensis]
MNIKWRLSLRLIVMLVLVLAILLVLAGRTLYWSLNELTRIESARDFENAGLYRLVQTVEAGGDDLRFDAALLEQVRRAGGWLQRIDESGRVTNAFFTPPDVPTSYGPGELVSYWLGKVPFPYQLYLWIQEKDGVVHTLLYGFKSQENLLLQRAMREGKRVGEGIALPEALQKDLKNGRSWVQVLDAEGAELASFNKPAGVIDRFPLQELALRSIYSDRYGWKIASKYDPASRLTWMVSTPLPGVEPGKSPAIEPEQRVLIVSIGSLLVAALIVFAIVAFWFGHRFGSPLLHLLQWLRELGQGRYAEPVDRKGRPISRNGRGRRKRNYRVYGDVMQSLDALSATLHRNDRLRQETEQLRDEWIAGVSHDLKTPLSSIKGYAHMLESPAYEWSQEEVRSFAKVMLDKSSYMDNLINDLTLAYRLRAGSQPPLTERTDMNAYLKEGLLEAVSHPGDDPSRVKFVPSAEPVEAEIYAPWFQRIVDNLVANALLHNPKGTTLAVTLAAGDPAGFTLTFRDDGSGMDEQTAARLFDRYYRGTNTESSSEGTGLGLAVTQALVEALGGSIEVETAVGRGTCVRLTWGA